MLAKRERLNSLFDALTMGVFQTLQVTANEKIVPSGYMSLMHHGLLVRLKYVEVVSVFTA